MFCSKCGCENLTDAKFCAECGNKLRRPFLSFHPKSVARHLGNSRRQFPTLLLAVGIIAVVFIAVVTEVIIISERNAQNSKQDELTKQSLIQTSVQAQRYFNENDDTYSGLCRELQEKSDIEQTFNICQEDQFAYAITTPLKNGKHFCVDSRGNSIQIETDLSDNQTSCVPVEPLSADAALNAELKKSAESASSTLPMILDAETRLDSVTVTDDNKMNYTYTLLNYSVGEIEWNGFSKTLQPTLKARYCDSPEGRYFRDRNVPVSSLYYDTYGLFVGEIEITNADCQQ